MSHITLARNGLAAVEARNWEEALTQLSAALRSSTNPGWLIARSKALIGLNRYAESLDDANLAWHTAYQRNSRTLMAEAHYRRAVAYFRLGQYANADCCCIYTMRLIKGSPAVEKEDPAGQHVDESGFWKVTIADAKAEANNDDINKGKGGPGGLGVAMGQQSPQAKEWRMASTLRIQTLAAMEKLPADDSARKITVSLKPEEKKLADIKSENEAKETKPAVTTITAAAKPQIPSDTPLRLQEFQSNTTMSVSIFSKGVNKEKLKVEFLADVVRLDPIVYPNGDEKEYQLDLWGEIDPSASKYTVTPNKVELSLAKKTAGKWPKLKAEAASVASGEKKSTEAKQAEATTSATTITADAPSTTSPTTDTEAKGKAPAPVSKGPAYPTSSRSGPKDWDKFGEDEKSDDEKDVNFFFKKIYKNATPEQQRAMMKSFTESNGTSLSTDWDDVKDRMVDTVPPEGVEAKKWDK